MVRTTIAGGLSLLAFLLVQSQPTSKQTQTPKPSAAKSLENASAPQLVQKEDDTHAREETVKVTIATSRPEVTTSGDFGVYADLENVAAVPITLFPRETTLVIQPELTHDQDCVIEIQGFFPTEKTVEEAGPLGGPIVIPPKEHYQVFWSARSNSYTCAATRDQESWVRLNDIERAAKRFIEFLPGDYAFVVVGKAHLTPEGKAEDSYHTFVQGTKLHVGLSQLEAVGAAMLGGLLAYFVVALRPGGELRTLKEEHETNKRSGWSKWGVILRSLVSAALLSAVITVILSRISDTQFPIKVSVSDFWGALTIGFVAFFTGNKLIDKLVGTVSPQAAGKGIHTVSASSVSGAKTDGSPADSSSSTPTAESS